MSFVKEFSDQVSDTYRRMAKEANYRPTAPSDGMGNITVPVPQLNLEEEIEEYIADWWKDGEHGSIYDAIGCANWPDRPALIFVIEAARCICGGTSLGDLDGHWIARRLLLMALAELDRKDSP
jgi:hypothetical protein